MATVLSLCAWSSAFAAPVIDGKFDPSEGYTTGFSVSFALQGGGNVGGGQLWTHQDAVTGNVSAAFSQPLNLVDNSYGTTRVGWGSFAPSGKSHNFSDLTGSDKAEFKFTNGVGTTVLDIFVDYLSAGTAPSGFKSLGATGGDGSVVTGSASNLLASRTSLDYNLNTVSGIDGFSPTLFTTNSPDTGSPNPVGNTAYLTDNPPSAPGWLFEVVYEIQVSGSLFTNGFGGVTIPAVHDSPNKLDGTLVTPILGPPITPGTPIPEPTTLLLLSSGMLGVVRRRCMASRRA